MTELTLNLQNYNQEQLNEVLLEACKNGDLEMVRYVLTSPELTIHADIHADKDYAFQWACHNGHLEVVKYLLTSHELTDHAIIQTDNYLAFRCAGQQCCWNVIRYLLSLTGNMYIDFQKTSYNLDWAIESEYSDTLKAMVKSLYKNDMIGYLENIPKIEEYCQNHGLNFEEWQEEMVKEDIDINSQTTELFI